MKLPPLPAFLLATLALASCGGTERDPSAPEAEARPRAAVEGRLVASADSPSQGQVIESSWVSFSGRSGARAGSTIAVAAIDGDWGRHACSAIVDSRQTWTCTQKLPDGGYTWTAQVVPGGPLSPGVDFVVHTRGVQAPLLDRLPSPGSDNKPILTGTVSRALAHRGWILEVSDNGHEICVVQKITSTQWFCALSQRLADGPHLLSADVSYGENGVSSPASNPSLYVVKTSIAPPTVDPVPSPTSVTRPTFSGTGEPGATVTVAESGSVVCQALVAAGGPWACTSGPSLADGTHTEAVSQRDAAGNSSRSVSVSFVVDTHVPKAPTLDPVRSPTSDPRPTFSGAGEPGDRVSVIDAYAHLLCSSPVDATGAFSCAPPSPLADGDYLIAAFQVTPLQARSAPSASQVLSIRTLAAPLLDAPPSPTRDPVQPLGGTAQPGALVEVMLGEASLCASRADAGGRWTCRPGSPLADGAYLIVAQESDGLGHASGPSATRSLVVDTTPPAAPVLDNPVSPTRRRRPTLSGSAEARSSVVVGDASSGARLCGAFADDAGAFSCLPAADLPLGTTRITAVATDQAGNTSVPASPVSVTVSDTVPAPPSIESPPPGAEIEENHPMISGRTAPGTSVQVTLDGVAYAAQVDPDGRWNLAPPQSLALGAHAVSATATDLLFNVSDKASSRFSIIEGGFARGGCASGGTPGPLLALLALLFAWPRRSKYAGRPGRVALALAFAALPLAARAQAPSVDVSLFRPAAGGDGFAAVEGSRPPLPGEAPLELRLWADYAVQPLVFVSQSGARDVLVRSRTGSVLGVQAHLLGPLSVAAQVPLTLAERGDLSGLPGSSRGPSTLLAGFGDLRLTPRLSLLRQEWAGVDLATQVSLEVPTARAQTLTDDGRARAEGLVALGRRIAEGAQGSLDLLGNVFVRLRPPHQLLDVKSGSEAGLRVGAGWSPAFARAQPWLPTRLYLELEGRSFLRAGFAAGSAPAEWRVGTTLCPVRNLAVDLGGGGALSNGVGAPRARFLFGLGWSPSSCGQGASSGRALVAAPAAVLPAPAPVKPPEASPPPEPSPRSPPPSEPPSSPALAEAPPAAPPAAAEPPPAPDRDGDGVADADDACPDEPGPAANQGCPEGIKQRVVVSADQLRILDEVKFASGKAKLARSSYPLLDQVAKVIASHPDLTLIQVEGHTDDRGSKLSNLLLSQARAEAVAAYLESKGIASDRLRAKGFGPEQPIAGNGTAQGRARNRRVSFTVLKSRARVIEAIRPRSS